MTPKLPKSVVITIDDREKRPWDFLAVDTKVMPNNLAVTADNISKRRLTTGDYVFAWWMADPATETVQIPHSLLIERKSLHDLVGTLSNSDRRDRFFAEIRRAQDERPNRFRIIVDDATHADIVNQNYTQLAHPKSLLATLATIEVRYGVRVEFCATRGAAIAWALHLVSAMIRLTEAAAFVRQPSRESES